MNHAKLEASRHTVFLIPVCTGGLRTPDRGSGAVRLRRKVADTASRSWGAPQRQGASDGGFAAGAGRSENRKAIFGSRREYASAGARIGPDVR